MSRNSGLIRNDKGELLKDGKPFNNATEFKDKSLTVQASADEVDINRIVARAIKGQSVPVFKGEPFYGDVSEFSGLQDAIMKVQESEDLFMSYPAELRSRFDNDPVKFVEFLEDSNNHDEAVKLGLAQRRPEAPPKPIPEVPAPAEGSK